jgi:hypothetical protein
MAHELSHFSQFLAYLNMGNTTLQVCGTLAAKDTLYSPSFRLSLCFPQWMILNHNKARFLTFTSQYLWIDDQVRSKSPRFPETNV